MSILKRLIGSIENQFFWWFGAVLILALALRLPYLGGSFWMDEAAQALEVTRPWHQQLNIAYDFQPPLLHLLLHVVQYVSTSEWWLRLWGAVLPGLASIAFVLLIAKEKTSKLTALIIGILLSTNSFHVFFSQELRPYALPAAFASISWYVLILQLQNRANKWLVWYTLATIAGLYSSYLYPFLVLSQAVWIVWQSRSRFLPFLTSWSISALAFAPWLPYLYEQLQVGSGVRENLPGWDAVVSITQLKAPVLVGLKMIFGVVLIDFNAYFVIGSTGVLALTAYLLWQHTKKNSKQKSNILLWLTWLIIPLLASWLVSFVIPVVRPKRLLWLWPVWYLVLAEISNVPWRKGKNIAGAILLTVVVFLNTAGLYAYYTEPILQRENWRKLHATITTQYPSDTVVVMSFPDAFAPWSWYDDGSYPVITTGELYAENADLTQKLKPVVEYSYVLVFDYLRDLTDPNRRIDTTLNEFGFTEIGAIDTPNIGFVRIFTTKTATIGQL